MLLSPVVLKVVAAAFAWWRGLRSELALDPWTLLEGVNSTPIARHAVEQSQFVAERFWEDA